MRAVKHGLVVAGMVASSAAVALADPPRTPPAVPGNPAHGGEEGHGEFKQAREKLRQQVIDQMQTMRMWKITEELKLNEATAAQVFPLLARLDEQEREIARERGEIFHQLRNEVQAPAPDSARIGSLIDRFVANRARKVALEQEKLAALRRILTPVQLAKILMLLPRIDEGFRHHIRETMNGGRFGGGGADRGAFGRE